MQALHFMRAGVLGLPRVARGLPGACLRFQLKMQTPVDEGPWTPHRIRKGALLARAGRMPVSLFMVHAGCLRVATPGGAAQRRVLDFAMRGDWLGTEALAGLPWGGDVVALEDGEVLTMSASRFEAAAAEAPELRTALYRHFAVTMRRDRGHIVRLGLLSARQRLALFLLDLSERVAVDGPGAEAFHLPMLRADIGSYLGLALESVSRAFTALQQQGTIRVRQRQVELRDPEALRDLAQQDRATRPRGTPVAP